MKITDLIKAIDDLDELYDSGDSLEGSLREDSDCDINDWAKMLRIMEKLSYFRYMIFVQIDHKRMIEAIENEKDRFIVQKEAKFHTESFMKRIETLIEISRNWKMRDYRCINFQKRMEDFFVNLRELVKE